MSSTPNTPMCCVCAEPESLCVCNTSPEKLLARHLFDHAPQNDTITIGRDDYLTLCERAYAWGQQKSVQSESAATEYTRGRLDGYVAGRIFEAKRCADLCKDNDGTVPDNTAQAIHDSIQQRIKDIS